MKYVWYISLIFFASIHSMDKEHKNNQQTQKVEEDTLLSQNEMVEEEDIEAFCAQFSGSKENFKNTLRKTNSNKAIKTLLRRTNSQTNYPRADLVWKM